MMPHESIQAHKDLNGKVMFPIHNGTFDLSLHAWYEPFEMVSKLAKEHTIDVRFPKMGDVISLLITTNTYEWWQIKN